MGVGLIQVPPLEKARRKPMRTPDEVAAMLAPKARGWGVKRIAREFGDRPKTVRRYVREGSWSGYSGRGGCRPWRSCRADRRSGWYGTAATPTWFGRNWRPSTGRWSACERWSGPVRRTGRSSWPRRGRRWFEALPGRQLRIDFDERRAMGGDRGRAGAGAPVHGGKRLGIARQWLAAKEAH